MRFYMYTQHLQTMTDPVHCVHLGEFAGVREVQARLVRANRWNLSRDAFCISDGVCLVNHHTWSWYGKSVRSRVIESFAYVIAGEPELVPDCHHFIHHLAPSLQDMEQIQRKVDRFAKAGRLLNGDFCKDYYPAMQHVTACPYCSYQFIHDVTDKNDLKLLEARKKAREFMRKLRATRRAGAAKARSHRVLGKGNVKGEKFKYAFALPPEEV